MNGPDHFREAERLFNHTRSAPKNHPAAATQIGEGTSHCARCNKTAKVHIWDRGYYHQVTWQRHRKRWWWILPCDNSGRLVLPSKQRPM